MRVINKSFLSANQQYKLSGSTLPFKDWLNREKEKGEVIPKSGVSDVLEDALLNSNLTDEVDIYDVELKKEDKKSTVLGLSKPILMLSVLVIVGAVAYKYYYKK
tara:strand:+ start:324 stop:635 length:312 start_codon:yes stop_codon:yes gene_type:complete